MLSVHYFFHYLFQMINKRKAKKMPSLSTLDKNMEIDKNEQNRKTL